MEEKAEIRKVFQSMDIKGDGKLSREELIIGIYIYIYIYIGLSKVHGEHYPIIEEVDQIMKNVDIAHNGYIDYSGMYI